MKVEISCPNCRKKLRVPGSGQGKVKCPHCHCSTAIRDGKIVTEVSLKNQYPKSATRNTKYNVDQPTTPFYIMGVVIIVFFYIFCSFISWTIELDEWSGLVRTLFFLGFLSGIVVPIWLYHKE
ncbi:hypothetical protein [Pseudopedobacter beijingensis]|uniref:MJ0042 family finger-like domain-containing protein n=1 Tax=Pseudopedobacter beijingensis TaxID=1207056 RepID=A0ABW4IDD0_9SPHI